VADAEAFLQNGLIVCCQMEARKTYRAGMKACNEKYDAEISKQQKNSEKNARIT
jgi:hypothetical protein